MRNISLTVSAALITLSSLVSCESNGQQVHDSNRTPRLSEVIASEKQSFQIDTIADGLENPWGMAWLPDGRLLINERRGEILVFNGDVNSGEHLTGLPSPFLRGQSGLLDIQLHPNYVDNGWIYVTYAKPGNEGGSTTLIRFKLNGNNIEQLEELYQTQPVSNAGVHFGGRIIFDNDG